MFCLVEFIVYVDLRFRTSNISKRWINSNHCFHLSPTRSLNAFRKWLGTKEKYVKIIIFHRNVFMCIFCCFIYLFIVLFSALYYYCVMYGPLNVVFVYIFFLFSIYIAIFREQTVLLFLSFLFEKDVFHILSFEPIESEKEMKKIWSFLYSRRVVSQITTEKIKKKFFFMKSIWRVLFHRCWVLFV